MDWARNGSRTAAEIHRTARQIRHRRDRTRMHRSPGSAQCHRSSCVLSARWWCHPVGPAYPWIRVSPETSNECARLLFKDAFCSLCWACNRLFPTVTPRVLVFQMFQRLLPSCCILLLNHMQLRYYNPEYTRTNIWTRLRLRQVAGSRGTKFFSCHHNNTSNLFWRSTGVRICLEGRTCWRPSPRRSILSLVLEWWYNDCSTCAVTRIMRYVSSLVYEQDWIAGWFTQSPESE